MSSEYLKLYSRGNFIQGEFHPVTSTDFKPIRSISPADSKDCLGEFPQCLEHVDLAVEKSREAFLSWRKLSIEERAGYLQKYAKVLEKHKADLAQVLAREVGKPLWEATGEAGALIGKVNISLKEGLELSQDKVIENILPGTTGAYRHRALGVLAVLGPFNFPAHLPNGHIVPALLYGNTVVFKPSEKTPAVGQLMAQIFQETGFPPGVIQVIQGEREVAQALVAHNKVHGVLFTGSYQVGQAIKKATLDQPWKVLALEMGGKNSALVFEDANLEQALFETLTGAFLTTGQRCSATSKVLVHKNVLEQFSEAFVQGARDLVVGHPLQEVFMGPVIDEAAMQTFFGAIEQCKEEGFEVLLEPGKPSTGYQGFYLTPAVSRAQKASEKLVMDSTFLQTEIFGPSVTILPFETMEEAIAMANATEYGLVASVFSSDRAVFEECWYGLETGLVNFNKATVGASSKLPFGGLKASGNFFPTALTASRYCSFPVTSMEVAADVDVQWTTKGMKAPKLKA